MEKERERGGEREDREEENRKGERGRGIYLKRATFQKAE
jgi:hypothetical protein